MFDKFVADLLTSYLGEYFDNIDREQVKVSVWNGLVHMHHLKVRRDALRFFDVPVCVLMGTIEELTVVIPWTRLRSESVVVQLRKAQLIVSDKETACYNLDQEVREARARRTHELASADEVLLQAFRDGLAKASAAAAATAAAPATTAPAADAGDSSDSNFTARLKASILNNIRVEVDQLSVHYTSCLPSVTEHGDDDGLLLPEDAVEDSAAPVQQPPPPRATAASVARSAERQASLTFQIKQVKTCGCNERFEPAFVAPGERMVRQLIQFSGVAASLRTGAAAELPFLKPLDISLELAYQPVYTDVSTPQYMLAAQMQGGCACVVTSEACITCYGLAQYLGFVRQRLSLRRLRPAGQRPTVNPSAWWRYAVDAVKQQVRQSRSAALNSAHKPTPFSWLTYTATKRKRDRYVRLYLRHQRAALEATAWLEPLTVDEHVEMISLEDDLAVDTLKLAKRLAVERVGVERAQYEKVLSEKKAQAAAAHASATAPQQAGAAPKPHPQPQPPASVKGGSASGGGGSGGWFSLWCGSESTTASGAAAGGGTAGPADSLSEETKAEMRELVQLMTAERWTEAQRAVIAQEFGMSADEARALAQPGPLPLSGAPPPSRAASSGQRSAPRWITFLQARALSVELQSRTGAAGTTAPASEKADRLAQVTVQQLQAGAEWREAGATASAGPASSPKAAATALPLAYYWGTMDRFAVTAASLPDTHNHNASSTSSSRSSAPSAVPEQVIFSVARGDTMGAASAGAAVGQPRTQQYRTRAPLEACWSVLPDACRQSAAVEVEWTVRSPQQLTSRTSALHAVRVGLEPVCLVVDVVPLRHLTDFFFTVMWPPPCSSTAAPAHVGEDLASTTAAAAPPLAGEANRGDDFTALGIPTSAQLTRIERRCAAGADARRVVLRRKVERQRSLEWTASVEAVHVSLSEVPQVQGCELALTQVRLCNDVVHRLQRQERLRGEVKAAQGIASPVGETAAASPAAAPVEALGARDTDWVDYTHVHIAAVRIGVFLPTSAASASAPPPVTRATLMPDTSFAVVVERSMVGRCHPEMPQWHARVSSRAAVRLTWSRTTLSVLTTACSTLTDLAASVGATVMQRGAAQPPAAGAAATTVAPSAGVEETFHVRVLPHDTGRAYWHGVAAPDVEGGDPEYPVDPREAHYKRLHPFSAARAAAAMGSDGGAPPQRVDVRPGVCVLFHAQRPTFPGHYYTLQDGCTRVRRSTGSSSGGGGGGAREPRHLVHLYVAQGGVEQEPVLTREYAAARRLLLDAVRVPAALLLNAVWLERAVEAWLLGEDAARPGAPAPAQVREALARVRSGAQAVPCRYAVFQCATEAEAEALEGALRRCCVAAQTPPLLMRPAVQARFEAAVAAPELRKQPVLSMTVSLASLRMTCVGSEPAVWADSVDSSSGSSAATPRADAALTFAPFFLRYDRFREKQRYELSVAQRVALSSTPRASGAGTGTRGAEAAEKNDGPAAEEVTLLDIAAPPRAPDDVRGRCAECDASALFLRLVLYKRPSPLPSVRRGAIRVGPSARLRVRAGSRLLSWAEAWWDVVGLLTNRLFGEEVTAGYPWRPPIRDDGAVADAETRAARAVEAAWLEVPEYGGLALSNLVDVTAPAMQVDVELGAAESAATSTILSAADHQDTPFLRFRATDASMQWRQTEASHHVGLRAAAPQLQWCCPPANAGTASEASLKPRWVTLMDPLPAPEASALSVDFAVHRARPMLSVSDWLRAAASDDGGAATTAATATGIRDHQVMELELCGVQLLYWHPLLLHLIHRVREGLVPRAVAVVAREPCWFHAGALRCPPLTWTDHIDDAVSGVAWTHLRKAVTLRCVELRLPQARDWVAQASAGLLPPPACLRVALEQLHVSDCVQVPPPQSTPPSPATSPAPGTAVAVVDVVYCLDFTGMVIAHAEPRDEGAFEWRLPSWRLRVAHPLFHAGSLWGAGMAWDKSLTVTLPSVTESCTLRGTCADLAEVMDYVHASFVQPAAVDAHAAASAQEDAGSPMSLLQPAVEQNTWTFTVSGAFALVVLAAVSDTRRDIAAQAACVVQFRDATASVARTERGELRCVLAAHRLQVGVTPTEALASVGGTGGGGGSGATRLGDAWVPVAQPVLEVGPLNPADAEQRFSLQYGWRWSAAQSTAHAGADVGEGKAVRCAVEAGGCLALTADSAAARLLHDRVMGDVQLRTSMRRYGCASPSEAAGRGGGAQNGADAPAESIVRLSLQQVICRVPCSADASATATTTPAALQRESRQFLLLDCTARGVLLEWRKDGGGAHTALRVGRLVHGVLEERHVSRPGAAAVVVPLVLEQPGDWRPPVTSTGRPRGHTSPQAHSPSRMDVPKPRDASLLDELFGDLPATQPTAAPPPAVAPPVSADAAPASAPPAPSSDRPDLLVAVLDDSPVLRRVRVELEPLWLVAPSVARVSTLLAGVRAQLKACANLLTHVAAAPSPPLRVAATGPRCLVLQLRSGTMSLFVGQREVTAARASARAPMGARAMEAAVRDAVDGAETLLLVADAVTVSWDSEPPSADAQAAPASAVRDGRAGVAHAGEAHTVLHLHNTSICALQGWQCCSVLLERFSVQVQRRPISARGAAVEEWHLGIDPLQLTLTQFHYAALLRVALQQTSLVATVMKSASTASQSLAVGTPPGVTAPDPFPGTGTTTQRHGVEEELPVHFTAPARARRLHFRLSSLRLCVRADDDGEGEGSHAGESTAQLAAVYMELKGLDATYYTGKQDWPHAGEGTAADDLCERGAALRLEMTLDSCLLGTENAIPTLALAAGALRVAQDEASGAYSGALQVGQVTVTVETVPMMAWVDLLYAPYLQEVMPNYTTAREHVMQQDLSLEADLVLSERTPLRVQNRSYSLLYVHGNGRTIYLSPTRGGPVLFLDEGVTLRIVHAVVSMAGDSVEAYVAAGNGSYVVVDRETCTVVPPPSSPLQSAGSGGGEAVVARVVEAAPSRRKWQRLVGEVQVQLRISEPRALPAADKRGAGAALGAVSAQRTLVLYSHMNLCLVNAAAPTGGAGAAEMTAAFDLAHAGVRSEYLTHDTAADATELIADWATKILMTEETKLSRPAAGGGGAAAAGGPPARARVIHASASRGVEMRVRYSDVVFVVRAARHAQAAVSRWKDVVRRDVWSSLAAIPADWAGAAADGSGGGAAGADGEAVTQMLRRAHAVPNAAAAPPTSVSVAVQLPYVSFVAVDDSQDTDTPLFCVRVSDLHTPSCTSCYPDTTAEVCFTAQLQYYELNRSQWASVLHPVEVRVGYSARQNTSLADFYDRKGHTRLSVQTSGVKLCLSLELLHSVRQLLLLRATFHTTGVATLATRSRATGERRHGDDDDGGAAATYHAFTMTQTTGMAVTVRLPGNLEQSHTAAVAQRGDVGAAASSSASASSHILQSGQEWAFNLPRFHGLELPREHQNVLVQLQTRSATVASRPSAPSASAAPLQVSGAAAVALATVGVQRVVLGSSGPPARYLLADVSAAPHQQGQKRILLHTLVTFTNRLSVPLQQLAPGARDGRYDALGTVPPGASVCVPLQVLRRRVHLALRRPSPNHGAHAELPRDAVASLGISYDCLPCLAGATLLCVCTVAPEVGGGGARLASGRNFEVVAGVQERAHFLLRVQAAASQPADVLRHPALAPLLRAVTVAVEAVVTIRNAVGVPLTLSLLTSRIQPGTRLSLLDASPDTAIYTQVSTVAVGVSEVYNAAEMDPLDDVCLSVALQQPNGCAVGQWATGAAGSMAGAAASQPPACIHAPQDKTRRDAQVVLVDPANNASLVLAIKYEQREVVLYCPHWIVNETTLPLQLADTSAPHQGDTDRCAAPIAGLSGRTVRTATVAPWGQSSAAAAATGVGGEDRNAAGGAAGQAVPSPFLYHSLRAASSSRSKNSGGDNGLFVRVWEPSDGASNAQAGWSEWSTQPLRVHAAAEAQVVTCASRRTRGALWVLSCRVEMGHQAAVHAYSDTRVVSLRPRWVLVNKSPYAVRLAQHGGSRGGGSIGIASAPIAFPDEVPPFSKLPLTTLGVAALVAAGGGGGGTRLQPWLSFSLVKDTALNVDECAWSPPFAVDAMAEQYVNVVHRASVPIAEHWPQSAGVVSQRAVAGFVPDRPPPLRPEDVEDVNGEVWVRREEAKVFSITTYEHKGSMLCVELEEAAQPPLVLENRTPFTVCLRQRGVRRVSTVFPRRRKAWTWDVPPAAAAASTPQAASAEIELWVALEDEAARRGATCALDFDPQRVGKGSGAADGFQRELDVDDAASGVSTMLFVRVRGVHGVSYAVSITMEPTIDAYGALPFPQFAVALRLASVHALCRAAGEREGQMQDALLLAVEPVDFSFSQGYRSASRDRRSQQADDGEGGDVQLVQLRLRRLQVDDERPEGKEKVVMQLVDDKESGFQVERRLLRTTPLLYCSLVAVRLAPVELHVEDSFIDAVMRYRDEVEASWLAVRSPSAVASHVAGAAAHSSGAAAAPLATESPLPPWQAHLEQYLANAKLHAAVAGGGGASLSLGGAVPLWSRVVAIQQLLVDPLLVSLSLYRSPGAADDPLWKLAGAASLLVGSTQDARLQWDAVQRRNVCDPIWRLVFLYRESYAAQMQRQYMTLVNIMGLDTMRNFVSGLLSVVSDEPADRRGSGAGGGAAAGRRQKPRVPCRRAALFPVESGRGGSAEPHSPAAAAAPNSGSAEDDGTPAEAPNATTAWVLRVPERVVRIGAQRSATVADVARTLGWDAFASVAQVPEMRAFGGAALASALAAMPSTPRFSALPSGGDAAGGGGVRRLRALDVVRRSGASPGAPQVQCSRCAELEALREGRLRDGAATPLPHPIRDGFLTWEEFAHHINWYEFVDMCTDDEVRTYAPFVRQSAAEASCNVCVFAAP